MASFVGVALALGYAVTKNRYEDKVKILAFLS